MGLKNPRADVTPPGSIKTHVTRIPRSPDANLSARRNPPPQYHSVVHITPEGRGEYVRVDTYACHHAPDTRPPAPPAVARESSESETANLTANRRTRARGDDHAGLFHIDLDRSWDDKDNM